jgi:hypothetical protein
MANLLSCYESKMVMAEEVSDDEDAYNLKARCNVNLRFMSPPFPSVGQAPTCLSEPPNL